MNERKKKKKKQRKGTMPFLRTRKRTAENARAHVILVIDDDKRGITFILSIYVPYCRSVITIGN